VIRKVVIVKCTTHTAVYHTHSSVSHTQQCITHTAVYHTHSRLSSVSHTQQCITHTAVYHTHSSVSHTEQCITELVLSLLYTSLISRITYIHSCHDYFYVFQAYQFSFSFFSVQTADNVVHNKLVYHIHQFTATWCSKNDKVTNMFVTNRSS